MSPKICEFEGLHIYMYNERGGKHHYPHVHVKSAEYRAVYRLDGKLMEGFIQFNKEKFIKEWILRRSEELQELWTEINKSNVTITVFKIDR